MWEILLLSLKLGDTPVFMSACLSYKGLVSSTENTEGQCSNIKVPDWKNVIFSYSSVCLLEQEKEPGGVARQCRVARQCGHASGASSLVSLLYLYGQRSPCIWIWMVTGHWPWNPMNMCFLYQFHGCFFNDPIKFQFCVIPPHHGILTNSNQSLSL